MPDYVPIQDLTIAGSVADSDLFPMSDGSGAYAVRGSTIKSYAASGAAAAAADAALSKTAAQNAATAAGNAQTAAETAQSAVAGAAADAAAAVTTAEGIATGLVKTFENNPNDDVLKLEEICDIPFFALEDGFVVYNTGEIVNSDNFSATNYVKVSQFDTISYKRTKTTTSNGGHGMCFYDINKSYLSGVRCLLNQAENGYDVDLFTVSVPKNAVYARFSMWKDTLLYGYFELKGKSRLSEAITCERLIPDGNGRIDLSVGIGEVVDLTTITPSANLTYLVRECQPGDQFTINGLGAGEGRLYGFVDASNKLIKVAAYYEERKLFVITAPENAAKIIIHNNKNIYPFASSFAGIMLSDRVYPMLAQSNTRTVSLIWQDGGVDGTGPVSGEKEKRCLPISINPGETLVIENTNKNVNIAVYAVKGDLYKLVGVGYQTGGGRFEITDWKWVYMIRLYNSAERPDPESGGYISVTVSSKQIPYDPKYYGTCSYPQYGIHRTYSNVKPFLLKEQKTITAEGIEPSESDCLITLPNIGWVEVKQDGQSVMFKIAKVDKNGNITFPVSEWDYYTYRYQGDGESTYYALVEASPGADGSMDIITRANRYMGIYTYTDEGAAYENGYWIANKHIAVIGDSITQGRFDKDGQSGLDSTTSKPFGELVAEVAGDDNFGNFGIGGALVSDSVSAYAWKSLLTNCGKVVGYDVVFVCGGTNDYGNDVPGSTFLDAYTEVVETLIENNTEVICCTPIYRHNRQGANTQGLWLVDYAEIIKTVAAAKGLKVIDLLRLTSDANLPRFMPDGLHPNEKGHKLIADWIVSEYDRLHEY